MNNCPHRPPCPPHITRWVCGKRTDLESAVNRGWMARADAERLASKWRLTLTPASRVYKGEAPIEKAQAGLYD